jgi:hypothetical protein
MLMSSDWSSFFAALLKSHQGQPVAIQQDDDLLLEKPPGGGAPLQGIELPSGHKQKALIITTAAQTYKIESPNLIWAVRNEQDELVAVEISDARERKYIMRFV